MNCGPGIPWKKIPAITSPENSMIRRDRKTPAQRKGGNSLWSSSRNKNSVPVQQQARAVFLALLGFQKIIRKFGPWEEMPVSGKEASLFRPGESAGLRTRWRGGAASLLILSGGLNLFMMARRSVIKVSLVTCPCHTPSQSVLARSATPLLDIRRSVEKS